MPMMYSASWRIVDINFESILTLFACFMMVQALQEGGVGDQCPRGDPVGILPAIPPAGDSYAA